MGQTISNQHPAVVLQSQYRQLRALLAVALIAVIGLTVAVVILAADDDQAASVSPAAKIGELNHGGVNPATGKPVSRDSSGPQESSVAAAVGSTPSAGTVDESRIAAALAPDSDASTGIDESTVANAVAGH